MSGYVSELFGRSTNYISNEARRAWASEKCPFVGGTCTKLRHDGSPAGVCAVRQLENDTPVICCPQRLYADNYHMLREVAIDAFSLSEDDGEGFQLVAGEPAARMIATSTPSKKTICVFGHGWGHELPLPVPSDVKGTVSIDWILVLLDSVNGRPETFCAAEVQTIDTTGSHQRAVSSLIESGEQEVCSVGLNWANVRKRIFTQIVYKGQVLERESKCTTGLYYVVPKPVFENNIKALGGREMLPEFPKRQGTITFFVYDYDPSTDFSAVGIRPLKHVESYTTGIHQLQQAFTSFLPSEGDLYLKAIQKALGIQEGSTCPADILRQ